MKRLPTLLPLLLGSPPIADLGPAETEAIDTIDAYCGKRGNECRVTFESSRMRVNDGKRISREQLVRFKYTGLDLYLFSCPDLPWVVSNRNSSGEIKTAKIIFRLGPTNICFGKALEVIGGTDPKTRPE